MTTTTAPQEYGFQAEIKQLLQLLSHSLYQNREIAIRELVSNASDALDKVRHVALTKTDIPTDALEINIEPDKDQRILVIRDNGVGMSQDELIRNLGTIAHSGSLDFLNNLSGDSKQDVSLIGQFGVGFYSAFMLADTVEVITRSCHEESGWRWQSDGSGSFTIEPAADVERGTQVRLHLKEKLDEFAEPARLKYILTRYSTFVPHPIKLDGEHINDQPPIWVEPKTSLKEEQYNNFYQYLTHHADEKPLWHLHLSSDSPFQFYAILYCPPTNFELMGFGRIEHGLHLCARRILVQNDNRELLPEYLRFLYGLVDSADLPLNVSRESLQDNTVFRKMQRVLVKRVLDQIEKTAEAEPEQYLQFYRQFGKVLREGINTDYENRERIGKLLRFQSSHSPDADTLCSLNDYSERMAEGQTQIYYLGGSDRAAIVRSPMLEIFRKQKLEVLYITDPIDEFALSSLGTFNDHDIRSIDAADLKLPGDASDDESVDGDKPEDTKDESAAAQATNDTGFDKVLGLFREALTDDVEEVRRSNRLTDSTCCLVNPRGGMSTQLQKLMQLNSSEFQISKLILEINAASPLIRRLVDIAPNADNADFIREVGRQLYANALVMSGLAPEVQDMSTRVESFMQELAQQRSSITTL